MDKTFDRLRFISNVEFLLESRGVKISELEEGIGTSKGYLSRIKKDEKAAPRIDIIMQIADFFNISIDTLLFVDLTLATEWEKELKAFLEKICRLTTEGKHEWKFIRPTDLRGIEPETFKGRGRIIKTSYLLEMPAGGQLYVLPVTVADDTIIEVQMKAGDEKQLIASTLDKPFRTHVKELYKVLVEYEKYPLNNAVRSVIDAFMKNRQ